MIHTFDVFLKAQKRVLFIKQHPFLVCNYLWFYNGITLHGDRAVSC